VFETLHQIAAAAGPAPRAASWSCWRPAGAGDPAGGPLPGPHRHRQPAARGRLPDDPRRPGPGPHRRAQGPPGAGAGLQHLLRPRPGRGHPGPGGLEEVERCRCGRATGAAMLAQRMSEPAEMLAKLGGSCAAEYKYDGIRIQAHRTADGRVELFTRRLERVSTSSRRGRAARRRPGAREVDPGGEVVAPTRPRASCARSRRSCTAAASTASPRRSRTGRSACSAFDLLYADGEDLTRLPTGSAGPAGAGGDAVPRLAATALHPVSRLETRMDSRSGRTVTDVGNRSSFRARFSRPSVTRCPVVRRGDVVGHQVRRVAPPHPMASVRDFVLSAEGGTSCGRTGRDGAERRLHRLVSPTHHHDRARERARRRRGHRHQPGRLGACTWRPPPSRR
jgi:hypothetical protein